TVLLVLVVGCGPKTETKTPDTASEKAPLAGVETGSAMVHPPSVPEDEPPPLPRGMAYIEGGQGVIENDFVTVASFYYDLHETTVEEYRACVTAGACTPPHGAE